MQLYSTPGSSSINNNLILNESRRIKDDKLQKAELENSGFFFYLVPFPPRGQSYEHTGVFIQRFIILYDNYKLAIPVTLFDLQM